ncbi:hypothetical protein [Rhizosphaericola mali]|uniref:Uncharacterized protein n=1 Tax=Rhizosphaericola mali TaxID=2545455 RepID=A0A5P2G3Y8_9BACT|nr:hypothetical protein [Rhizosphaericola mali]QES88849.1 hypothetical protein E0W69_009345 [Rhizosphaericola mali]
MRKITLFILVFLSFSFVSNAKSIFQELISAPPVNSVYIQNNSDVAISIDIYNNINTFAFSASVPANTNQWFYDVTLNSASYSVTMFSSDGSDYSYTINHGSSGTSNNGVVLGSLVGGYGYYNISILGAVAY